MALVKMTQNEQKKGSEIGSLIIYLEVNQWIE